ncbi:hypothetical protein C5167_030868 [Papaver somniferum]|nr:hypothetical protein C5167_030868 [Papaver somniferum]
MKKLERNLRRPSKNHSSLCTNHPSGIYNNHIQLSRAEILKQELLVVSKPKVDGGPWMKLKLQISLPVPLLSTSLSDLCKLGAEAVWKFLEEEVDSQLLWFANIDKYMIPGSFIDVYFHKSSRTVSSGGRFSSRSHMTSGEKITVDMELRGQSTAIKGIRGQRWTSSAKETRLGVVGV